MNDTQKLNKEFDAEERRSLALHAVMMEFMKKSHLPKLMEALGWTTTLKIMQQLGGKRIWIPGMSFSRDVFYTAAAVIAICRHEFTFEDACRTFHVPVSTLRRALTNLKAYEAHAAALRTLTPEIMS